MLYIYDKVWLLYTTIDMQLHMTTVYTQISGTIPYNTVLNVKHL
jgi:hypothetical protein